MSIKRIKLFGMAIAIVMLASVNVACSDKVSETPSGRQTIASLDGVNAFRQALADAGETLVVIDFYADWCGPCRQLAPVLEEIARKHADKAAFYKVNVDRNRDIAQANRITGIPHVMFIRHSEPLHSIIGLQHSDAYLQAIGRFSAP